MDLRCRYFPDKDTAPVAEFVRGELAITAPVNRVASQTANVVDIDIKGVSVGVSFNPTWSSTPISAEDRAGINQLILNSLKTSFLPTQATLPAGIAQVQFKTLRGAHDALAVLLNMEGGPGNPASQTTVFLGSEDDFAIGAGADFVRRSFQGTIDSILNTPIEPIHVPYVNITYTISNIDPHDHRSQLSAELSLENGKIMLIFKGHAHTPHWWAPDFDFTAKQPVTLSPNGSTAELVLGSMSFDTSSVIADRFKGPIRSRMEATRDKAINEGGARDAVRDALNADSMFGGLLGSLLKPTTPPPGWNPPDYFLQYSAVDISPAGILLHGALYTFHWKNPQVQFEKIPSTGSGPLHGALLTGDTYSALNSWIPGGTIQRFEWSMAGEAPFAVDENRFIATRLQMPEAVSTAVASSIPAAPSHTIPGYVPLCLTIKGTRLTTFGPVVAEQVSASICGYNSFPILDEAAVGTLGALPMVALTQPGAGGMVDVTGHATAGVASRGVTGPNLIVHFADENSAPDLESLSRALSESGRDDAPTAILAIVGRDQLAKTRHVPGVVYAESNGGSWERAFGVKPGRRPLTLIAGPKRNVKWQYEGPVDGRALSEALRKSLDKTTPARITMIRPNARIGHAPPNFIFEHAPGAEVTLRKLLGRELTIVFWNSSSKASIDAVVALQQQYGKSSKERSVVLAVNDGESADVARRVAQANKISATVIPDPERQISRAYGISVWPTVVSVDAAGAVMDIRQGRSAQDRDLPAPAQRSGE
jgi:peroxiredoxin